MLRPQTKAEIILITAMAIAIVGVIWLFLEGCTPHTIPTDGPWRVLTRYGIDGTSQECGNAEELRPLVERAYRAVVEVTGERQPVERPMACLLEQPDICGRQALGLPPGCVGRPECARRNGCAEPIAHYIWVSRWWPPLCRPSWPDEPNCVIDPARQRSDGMERALVVEMHAVLRSHDGYRVSHAPGSPDLPEIQRCWERYQQIR